MPKRTMAGCKKSNFVVYADRPWKLSGDHAAVTKDCPSYRKKEVAEVCLNCTKDKCSQSATGCAAYHEAVMKTTTRRGRQPMRPNSVVKVDGESHTLAEWAERLGITPAELVYRAKSDGYGMTAYIRKEVSGD